jgi:hypothetical protein
MPALTGDPSERPVHVAIVARHTTGTQVTQLIPERQMRDGCVIRGRGLRIETVGNQASFAVVDLIDPGGRPLASGDPRPMAMDTCHAPDHKRSMLSDDELLALMRDPESDRVERKASASDMSRLREAVCAFANDLPGHQAPGVIVLGIKDDGSCADLTVDDELLKALAHMRDDGKIQPLPSVTVQRRTLGDCAVALVIVQPSDNPPVRVDGRTWIRVGPRRAQATAEEERRLGRELIKGIPLVMGL